MSVNKLLIVPALLMGCVFTVNAEDTSSAPADTPAAAPAAAPAETPAAAPAAAPTKTASKKAGSGPNPFSDCGIGAALFPNTPVGAVISNVIWDVGTTAITSATASPQTCSGKRVTAAAFINDTYEQLTEETARGEGEHLTTVMNILECDSAHQGRAIAATRKAMGEAVAAPGYATQKRIEKASQLFDIIDTAVSTSCSV